MKEEDLVSRDITQVDLDVNRTFSSHIIFWDYYGVTCNSIGHLCMDASFSVPMGHWLL